MNVSEYCCEVPEQPVRLFYSSVSFCRWGGIVMHRCPRSRRSAIQMHLHVMDRSNLHPVLNMNTRNAVLPHNSLHRNFAQSAASIEAGATASILYIQYSDFREIQWVRFLWYHSRHGASEIMRSCRGFNTTGSVAVPAPFLNSSSCGTHSATLLEKFALHDNCDAVRETCIANEALGI